MQTLILILWNLYGLEALPTGTGTEKVLVTPEIATLGHQNESFLVMSSSSVVTSSSDITIVIPKEADLEIISEEVIEISGDITREIERTTIIEEDTDRPK